MFIPQSRIPHGLLALGFWKIKKIDCKLLQTIYYYSAQWRFFSPAIIDFVLYVFLFFYFLWFWSELAKNAGCGIMREMFKWYGFAIYFSEMRHVVCVATFWFSPVLWISVFIIPHFLQVWDSVGWCGISNMQAIKNINVMIEIISLIQ